MMQIGIMRVSVHNGLVAVPMGVRFARRIVRSVLVPMVCIVAVVVFVLEGLVLVFVVMPLGEMQP